MAIYEREFNPTAGNNPNGKVKFKLRLEWLTHGCVGEIELVEGVNFEFNTNRDSITLSTINGTLTDAPCIGYTFQIIAGNKLSLNPPFNAKEVSYGWGGYRQYNQTNTYKSNAPHNLTVLLNSSPADVQITIGGTSIEYSNAGFLPKLP